MDIAKTIRRWWADQRNIPTYGVVKSQVQEPLSAGIGVATYYLGGIAADESRRGRELQHLLQAVARYGSDLLNMPICRPVPSRNV